MNTYRIANTDLTVSRLSYGCMMLGRPEAAGRAGEMLAAALDQGINHFDHADVYGRGNSEIVFGEALRQTPGARDKIVLQSKCGIRPANTPLLGDAGRYDFSYDHIVSVVEGSLIRLQTDHLDLLLLHRPDALVEPEEVARAFTELHAAGKVRYFGVSNHSPAQIELLKRYVAQPLVANQLEVSLVHNYMIEEGVLVNQPVARFAASSGLLDYCRLHDILIEAWSPVASGQLIDPRPDASERVVAAAKRVAELAATHNTTREAIALAWLLRHPAGIQPIIGTTKVERLIASCQADSVSLTREEWYSLLNAARGSNVP
jgi:predicted oxidoreductase